MLLDSNHGLLALVPILTPIATAWVAQQERRILRNGLPLSPQQLAMAREIGVMHPDRVRLLRVDRVPQPGGPILGAAARLARLRTDDASGMTMRYGIFIRSDRWDNTGLVAHELVHTRQYEQLGGIRPFLRQYLAECLSSGYLASSLELEACRDAEAYQDQVG